MTQIQDEVKNTRLRIPVIYGLDAIHGQTYTLNSTLFPQNLAIAAARNPELVRQAAKVTAMELRSSGVRWNFAPVLDIGRQPLWSRFPEIEKSHRCSHQSETLPRLFSFPQWKGSYTDLSARNRIT